MWSWNVAFPVTVLILRTGIGRPLWFATFVQHWASAWTFLVTFQLCWLGRFQLGGRVALCERPVQTNVTATWSGKQQPEMNDGGNSDKSQWANQSNYASLASLPLNNIYHSNKKNANRIVDIQPRIESADEWFIKNRGRERGGGASGPKRDVVAHFKPRGQQMNGNRIWK